MEMSFDMRIDEIQPSQLYISAQKLDQVLQWFAPVSVNEYGPLPVKELNGRIIFTDGHTRAYAAYRMGLQTVRVHWDEDDLDWDLYQTCVDRCDEAGIKSVKDLETRIVSQEEYEILWIKRCEGFS